MPSHFSGPLLGSTEAMGGVFRDLPVASYNDEISNYQVWVEDFKYEMAAAQLITMGAHVDSIGAPTSPSQFVDNSGGAYYLVINPGTGADTGSSVVFDVVPSAASLNNTFTTPRALTSTTTLMTGRELVWAARVGPINDLFQFTGKAIFGWLAADATPLAASGGLPSMGTGCGAGFYFAEDSSVYYFGQQAALAALPPASQLIPSVDIFNLDSDVLPQWHTYGFRIRWRDASAGTGTIDYYVDDHWVGRIVNGLPMQSTQVYASTFAIANGAGAELNDLAVDWMLTAVTGPGR